MCTAQLQAHTGRSVPPLPQTKAFLEIPLSRMALRLLGQCMGAHTIYVGRPPGTRVQFCFLRNRLRPLLTNRDKAGFWKQHQLERP